jgi:hypothetical protein
VANKAHSLAGLFSQAVQDGLRKGVGDIALQVSQNARKKMLTTGSEAIGGFLSGGGVSDDGQVDPATGAPAWFAKVLKANFNTYLIIGQRGSGKTALALALGEARAKDIFMLDAPPALWGHVTPIKTVNDIKKVPAGSTVIIDDAGIYIPARRSMSQSNVQFGEIIAIARHLEITLIINAQYASQVDRFALEVTAYFAKMPEFGWEDIERPFLKPIIQEAMTQFAAMGEMERKEHVFVYVDKTKRGMLTYSPPPWYTTTISRFRGNSSGGSTRDLGVPNTSHDSDAGPVFGDTREQQGDSGQRPYQYPDYMRQ